MTVLSGWRAALAIVAALVVIGVLMAAFFWVAALAAVIVAVAGFNVLAVPRLARRLRVSELVIVGALLAVLAAGGWLLGGPVAFAGGVAAWIVGVAVPRVALRRSPSRPRRRYASARKAAVRSSSISNVRPCPPGLADDDAVVTFRRRD